MKSFTILILICMLSCTSFEKKNTQKPIAKAYDKYLYINQIVDIIPKNISPGDSALLVKNYVNRWIKEQLILRKAELNLTEEQKDISKQLDNYRASVLIFKYQQKLIKQKLDTIISNEEIEAYYNANESNFILSENIIKALYIKVPKTSPNIDKIKKIYKSEKKEDITQLETYCYQFATKYDYFDDNWISFNNIKYKIPISITDDIRFLDYNSYIETEDSLFHYLINIKEYKKKGTRAPLKFVENNIKSIILNKRKLTFISKLENNIYNDALSKNYVKTY